MLGALDGPIIAANTVTPSDSTVLPQVTRGLYIGTGGNITISWGVYQNGAPIANTTFMNVLGGTILPVRANYVLATGTTASSILALY